MAKDPKGHGSNSRGKPIAGHPYHFKSDAELRYIAKDASEAARATRGMTQYDPNSHQRIDTEGKYLDQANNAASVLGYRARGGKQDQHPKSNEHAAAILASGPKSDPVPVHPSQKWS